MNDHLEDKRDRTIFVEYYPAYILTSVWTNNGQLENYQALYVANHA